MSIEADDIKKFMVDVINEGLDPKMITESKSINLNEYIADTPGPDGFEESVIKEEPHDDVEYEVFVDQDFDGDAYVVLSASGHQVAEMDLDTWYALHSHVANRGKR